MKNKIFLLLIIVSCTCSCIIKPSENNHPTEHPVVEEQPKISFEEIQSFLKNTTYIYNRNSSGVGSAWLRDLNYTPAQHYSLECIQIRIKKGQAIVHTDVVLHHAIKDSKYYHYSTGKRVAVLITDRGRIIMTEQDGRYGSLPPIRYSCFVEYGNYYAGCGVTAKLISFELEHDGKEFL